MSSDPRLDFIGDCIRKMGDITSAMLHDAAHFARTRDEKLAQQVKSHDDEVDVLEEMVTSAVFETVMAEARFGRDLRLIVSAPGVAGELEKAADHAVKLCYRVAQIPGEFPPEMLEGLRQLEEGAGRMLAEAVDSYFDYRPERVASLIAHDQPVDSEFRQLRLTANQLIRENPSRIEDYTYALEAMHALEHMADQAVAIANRLKLLYEDQRGLPYRDASRPHRPAP